MNFVFKTFDFVDDCLHFLVVFFDFLEMRNFDKKYRRSDHDYNSNRGFEEPNKRSEIRNPEKDFSKHRIFRYGFVFNVVGVAFCNNLFFAHSDNAVDNKAVSAFKNDYIVKVEIIGFLYDYKVTF